MRDKSHHVHGLHGVCYNTHTNGYLFAAVKPEASNVNSPLEYAPSKNTLTRLDRVNTLNDNFIISDSLNNISEEL